MSNEVLLSSPTSEEVDILTSSEDVLSEESSEIETSSEIEESTETEVICQVADLTKTENCLEIITCFVIFFAVYIVCSMVYKLVKDIFN